MADTEDCSAVAAALNPVMCCVQSHAAAAQGQDDSLGALFGGNDDRSGGDGVGGCPGGPQLVCQIVEARGGAATAAVHRLQQLDGRRRRPNRRLLLRFLHPTHRVLVGHLSVTATTVPARLTNGELSWASGRAQKSWEERDHMLALHVDETVAGTTWGRAPAVTTCGPQVVQDGKGESSTPEQRWTAPPRHPRCW